MYAEYLTPTKRKKRTFNELCYVLRMDKETDYNISIPPHKGNDGWCCIPSVKDFFVPLSILEQSVKAVHLEEDDPDFKGLCLTVEF